MRRLLVRCTIVVLLCTAWPSAAEAGPFSFWAWLEELSGPGPFKGKGFSAPLFCYGVRRTLSNPAPPDKYELKIDWDCDLAKLEKTRVVINLEYLRLTSQDNQLIYPSGVSSTPRVKVMTFVPSINLLVHPMFTVGAGVGFARFSTDTVNKTVVRAVLQPVRVTVRPLAAFAEGVTDRNKKRWLEVLQIHLAASTFKGGFDAEDFGAVRGTFNAPYELQWSTQLAVDLSKFWPIPY